MYYLYRHVRPDKNQVFYVGIGTITGENLIPHLGNINCRANISTILHKKSNRKKVRGYYFKFKEEKNE